MNIRPASEKDIPFIINAILEIEKKQDSNTYSNLFGTNLENTYRFLENIFLDQENVGTEISLNTFIICEIDSKPVGCCALIFTNNEYYLNKAETFPIHLEKEILKTFVHNAQALPNHKYASEGKYFIEYIFVDAMFRGKGIAGKLIEHQIEKIEDEKVFINVFDNNEHALQTYIKLGFSEHCTVDIDLPDNTIYPSKKKIILWKKIH